MSNRLYGYADPLAIRAGEAVEFMLSAEIAADAEIRLVRLIHGDRHPAGPGFVEEEIDADLPARVAIVPQATRRGAFATVPGSGAALADLRAGAIHAFICPSRPGLGEQAIAGCWDEATAKGYVLLIDAGGVLRLRLGDGERRTELALSRRLAPGCWYFVTAHWDAETGTAGLRQFGCVDRWNSRIGRVAPYDYDDAADHEGGIAFSASRSAEFLIAGVRSAEGGATACYNGKIDRVGVQHRPLDAAAIVAIRAGGMPPAAGIVTYWDTSAGYSDDGIGDVIRDLGPLGLDAIGVNRPIRGMKGWNWKGKEDSFRLDPGQYGGIAFHEDALIDCGWAPTVRLKTPRDLRSGAYALRVRSNGVEDHVPFFVRAAAPRAPIAVLMPTFTYLAYANEHLAFEAPIAQAICANTPVVGEQDLHWSADAPFGLSTYDVHSDGAGVCYSSWRRPILNMRPGYRMPATGVAWAFPADLSLIWWLERAGYDYEILTDHDLHREGVAALAPYRAVLTGTHPEYYSERMLDGTEDYLTGGGRLLYLGGNGYYWVTGLREDEPWCIEVRKLESGSRAWQAEPGEGYLACTGERSGLWRVRGRAPQKLVGLGFTTEGMDESRPFERLPDGFDPAMAWIFAGIGADEPIGDFGLALGGASGIEMDRYDLALGTPPHARLLAASFGHSDNYPLVSEDIGYAFPGRGGSQDPQVRGDMSYFTTPNGGAVFAAGSIAWSQALPCFDGENNVARVMRNVLDAFLADQPLPA
ncbi:LamG domain-containing protein [Sphingomonas histidinilytica]|uniref:N,N-dimethylformamidase n=1 Tax=Rhizorhabdus histidinilytica TaxID=439228 RepID=A0A1T5CUS7_9SPHN|nr:N,N-dimethylformamidase beta subunit family domain-containing protein [Rhizorhabdus histidinilytica]MBO9379136.1 LamG domain-containing protein [Rhizorhabdus histidinilytica]SKB63127.1 N,N-dimethylformamidase [Rhizorhabdus histidinilytica]